MKNINFIVLIIVAIFISGCVESKSHYVYESKLLPLPEAKAQIEQYYSSENYNRDLKSSIRHIINYCSGIYRKNKNMAVIMYVEDVLISTYQTRLKHDFAETDKTVQDLEKSCMLGEFPLIKDSGILFEFLLSKGFKVILLSKRSGLFQVPLMENLASHGLAGWTAFYSTPQHSSVASVFLMQVIQGLKNSGIEVVATIAPVQLNIDEGGAGRIFAMPNYVYTDLSSGTY